MTDLTDHFPVEDATLSRLTDRLASSGGDEDLLEITYRTIDSPIGPLLLAATEAGLVRVAFASEGFDDVLTSLAERIGPRILEAPTTLDTVARELDEYFSGARHSFDLPLDFSMSASRSGSRTASTSGRRETFRQTVQHYLPHIGYGHTSTYKEVAEFVGNPRAVRAVGTACATNPLPVVVPCHRVLRTDGGLGGYLGGLEAKKFLLDLEQAA